MDPSKSSGEEIILDLFREMFLDFTDRYPLQKSGFQRDYETIKSRYLAEGFGFLSKVMPSLGKALEEGLETGILTLPRGFKKQRGTELPAFMQGILQEVFQTSGELREDACPIAISCARQALFLAYRYEIPYSPEQEQDVLNSFRATEELLPQWNPSDATIELLSEARSFVARCLEGFDPKDIRPRHGPGAVATGEKLEGKWEFSRLYSSIEAVYPFCEYYLAGGAPELLDRLDWFNSLSNHDSGTAKVVLVPKDSRGPRLISCEPLEYQWIQQGLGRALMSHVERSRWTRGVVNFTDQSINQRAALESSMHRVNCTIDLKDASDRVTLKLVEHLFPEEVFECLNATRTTATRLPNGDVVALCKFAPMGSALCFPVEAICFWAICSAVVRRVGKVSPSQAARQVRVYGDDIILPSMFFHDVVDALESCALLVNTRKSFYRGNFRESCGVDAFKGVDVTPVKIRTVWSENPKDASCYASWIAYANELAARGYMRTSEYMYCRLERVHGVIPYGTHTASFPCRRVSSSILASIRNADELRIRHRYNERLHRVEFRVKYLASARFDSVLDGWPRLLRYFTMGVGDDPSSVVVPRTTKIQHGWRAVG